MNSDKAADVRDSINALSCVAHNAEPSQNYGDGKTTTSRGDIERTHTGECVHLDDYQFRPAAINEAGQVAFDGGDPRPCYEVLLEPLGLPTRPSPTISIPPAVVYEIAKHDCRLRVTAGHRGRHTPGTVRIRDDFTHNRTSNTDSEQCDCGCNRFQIKEGVPHCERCGEAHDAHAPESKPPTLEDYV